MLEHTTTEHQSFFARKDIVISVDRYVKDALSAMGLGLFASLLIGLIIKTIGQQLCHISGITEETWLIACLLIIGQTAMDMMGPAIGISVAKALNAPPLVLFSCAVVGQMGATFTGLGIKYNGGPAGAFIAVCLAAEFGKMISKETKIDIIVTPAVTILVGGFAAKLIGPGVGFCLQEIGRAIEAACEWQPFFFGIFISVVVGLVLTAPISSAALCIMMGLGGLAAGAATAGCCAQMIGFAVASYKDNGVGGLISQGIGTSMLQVPNIVMHPWILVPPTLTAAITGPIATCLFHMTNNAAGAGMGTSGLVGQIMTLTVMGFTGDVLLKILIVQIILPAILSFLIYKIMYSMHLIKDGDMKLEI